MHIIESSLVGEEVLRERETLIVGISINNSYFKEENLERLITWSAESAQHVAIMIPDHPAVHTLVASGKTQSDAERIARLKSNALENKCRGIIGRLGILNVQVVRWKEISAAASYKETLVRIKQTYNEDSLFYEALRRVTGDVLRHAGVEKLSDTKLAIGVQFLLEELAFITSSDSILGRNKTAYVYHKTMSVLKDILCGRYVFKGSANVGFLTVE